MKRKLLIFMTFVAVLTIRCFAYSDTAVFLNKNTVPQFSEEWSIFAVNRNNYTDSIFNIKYYNSVIEILEKCGGVLSERKYTEYARTALALTSIGANPENICGYNLIEKLDNYESVTKQGINGAIFALIAADSHSYRLNSREKYIEFIVSRALPDGGFAMSGDTVESDITAMAICALSKYRDDEKINGIISSAFEKLMSMKNTNGTFSANGEENAESTAQVICALASLGMDVKKDYADIYNALMSFKNKDGSFSHIHGGNANIMATEQALCAVSAAEKNASVYDMNDIVFPLFSDIYGDENRESIEKLYKAGIVNGSGNGNFTPHGSLTRAELAAMTVRAVGAEETGGCAFADVSKSDWFWKSVSTASAFGIVKGIDKNHFAPGRNVTRAEAEIMIARAFRKNISEDTILSDGTKKYYITRSETARLIAENVK